MFLRGTYGVNINCKTDKANVRFSSYYQHNLNDIGDNTSAFCISAYAERKIRWQLWLGIGYDYLSGNDETSTSTTNNRFDILYGGRHGWYGYMDYFSTTPHQGLQDYMAKLTYKPSLNLSVQLHGHYFMLAADKYDSADPSKETSNKLGQELDLIMKWKFHQIATLECGYSIYSITNTLKQLKKVNDDDVKTPQFFYVMLTVKPSLWL